MKLDEIGEYRVHKWIRNLLNKEGKDLHVGDDAALIKSLLGKDILVSTDLTAIDDRPEHAGKLCIVQNFSDIICKGGTSTAFFLSLQLRRDTTFDYVKKLMLSAKKNAEFYGGEILGGDLKESEINTAVGTAIGTIEKGCGIPRRGAKVDDIVAVTLTNNWKLGVRWASKILEKEPFNKLRINNKKIILKGYEERWYLPYNEMQSIKKSAAITSSMDTSDGIGACLEIMGQQSKVGFLLYENQLKGIVDETLAETSLLLKIPLWKWVFSPGFDWEVVLTVERSNFNQVRNTIKNSGGDLYPIGKVIPAQKIVILMENNKLKTISPFRSEMFRYFRRDEFISTWLNHKEID